MLDSEAISERTSSAHLELSDNEVYPSVSKSKADQSSPHEREPSANSSSKDEEMSQRGGPFLIRKGIQAS